MALDCHEIAKLFCGSSCTTISCAFHMRLGNSLSFYLCPRQIVFILIYKCFKMLSYSVQRPSCLNRICIQSMNCLAYLADLQVAIKKKKFPLGMFLKQCITELISQTWMLHCTLTCHFTDFVKVLTTVFNHVKNVLSFFWGGGGGGRSH